MAAIGQYVVAVKKVKKVVVAAIEEEEDVEVAATDVLYIFVVAPSVVGEAAVVAPMHNRHYQLRHKCELSVKVGDEEIERDSEVAVERVNYIERDNKFDSVKILPRLPLLTDQIYRKRIAIKLSNSPNAMEQLSFVFLFILFLL